MKPCAAPGCSALLPAGGPARCPIHARVVDVDRRGSQRDRGYTRRWEHRRADFLRRYPLCGMRPGDLAPVWSRCHDEERPTPATVVDHVRPHKGDPGLFWDELTNWQALCAACHARKSQAGL